MQSAPNFMQGAMRNALSIQADPAKVAGSAATAFAQSGGLALKLTALIDAEEQQKVANLQADRTHALNTLKESNLQDWRQISNENSDQTHNLNQSKFDYEKAKDRGMAEAPTLSTSRQVTVGNEQDASQVDSALAQNTKDMEDSKYYSFGDGPEEDAKIAKLQDNIRLEREGILESKRGLDTVTGSRLNTPSELATESNDAMAKIDQSQLSDGEKVGLKLELKRQVEEATKAYNVEEAKKEKRAHDMFMVDYKAAAKTNKTTATEQKNIATNVKAGLGSGVVTPKDLEKGQEGLNTAVAESVAALDTDGMAMYSMGTKDVQESYEASYINAMKNRKTSGLSDVKAVQWAATIIQGGKLSKDDLKRAFSSKGQLDGESGRLLDIANTIANPELSATEETKYSKAYKDQSGDLEDTWDVIHQYGWFDDLFSYTGAGQDEMSEATYKKVLDSERKEFGTNYMAQANKYVSNITDEIGQRDTIDSEKIATSLLKVFNIPMTPANEEKVRDYAKFTKLRYDLKGKEKMDGEMIGVTQGFRDMKRMLTKYPDFATTDKDGKVTVQPIINVVSKIAGGKKNITEKYREIAYRGGPKTPAEKDFFGFVFMIQAAKFGTQDTSSAEIAKPFEEAGDVVVKQILGEM